MSAPSLVELEAAAYAVSAAIDATGQSPYFAIVQIRVAHDALKRAESAIHAEIKQQAATP